MNFDKMINPMLGNTELIETLYEAYKKSPSQVSPGWQDFFKQMDVQPEIQTSTAPKFHPSVSAGASDPRIADLIQAYRRFGHLLAHINPLETRPTEVPKQLKLETIGFHPDDQQRRFPTLGILPYPEASLEEIVQALRSIYCSTVGVEYVDSLPPEVVRWIQQQIEPAGFSNRLPTKDKKRVLEMLIRSELFESFLHTKYVGQKRFSLEGGETLIPMLEAVIDRGAGLGMQEVVLGMAHRGRLNVLSNILNKSYAEIFSEFDEGYIPESFEGTGDVKYHKGYFSAVLSSHGHEIKISLTPNPSHLESVNPVVEGQSRAKQVLRNDETERGSVFPVIVHGDAALSGQGIVYETLQFCQLPGYKTGGTIHLVINNQIGFTTIPSDSRSTYYCTDIAKAFSAPVFHVNAEDPEACVYVACLAVELRQKFHCDVFIDLVCYRKYGHNEGDEPAFTQPLEYQIIRKKKSIRQIYHDLLIDQGLIQKDIAENLLSEFKEALQKALEGKNNHNKTSTKKTKKEEDEDEKVILSPINTGVSIATLRKVTELFCTIPKDFKIHPKLENLVKERLEMALGKKDSKPIDWGMGETLAYATLLWDGISVRIAGQDVCRGTFSHRHAMWMDQTVEKAYFPLAHLKDKQGRFEIVNSSLSEVAALGFEYGYSLGCPDALVIWEAQFGDFANGAQVIIDQYLVSGEQKWGQKSRLTLLLPHGYEGQGPEHSSARMERFLTLTGHNNIIIANPTKPAQLFHLLRRQAMLKVSKPLVVFTPKGLLRYPACVNSIEDFVEGGFEEVIDDPAAPRRVERLIFCSGRIYYDLMNEREKRGKDHLAIVRIEQLYPLHKEKIKQVMAKHKGFKECIWVQEEPKNMGAWQYMRSHLEELLPEQIPLQYVGRGGSASPATGSHAMHDKELTEILKQIFERGA